MRLKSQLQRRVARHVFSPHRRDSKRRRAENKRRAAGEPHRIEYYHQTGDPYSHVLAQVLPAFCERYDIDLSVHVVPPPPEWAAPDRKRLEAYARLDAERLARRAGLDYTDPGEQPSQDNLRRADAALIGAINDGAFLQRATAIGEQLWGGRVVGQDGGADQVARVLEDAAERRGEQGHYLGAMLYYAGEWYWGLDRLHHLERRLRALGAGPEGVPLIFDPPEVPSDSATKPETVPLELHWYLSFRSPYTGIVADRVKALADAYGAELKLRYVLPMVMRGMQVPRMKGFYIMSDTVREAERLGIPFGDACDPVGSPVERGYAILHRAIEQGRGFEFARSFLSAVWSEGIDAGSDRGLKLICERAGLAWSEMKLFVRRDHWRAEAELNQEEMFRHGVWGVPSFRVGDVTAWGQDRLWVIEEALEQAAIVEQKL